MDRAWSGSTSATTARGSGRRRRPAAQACAACGIESSHSAAGSTCAAGPGRAPRSLGGRRRRPRPPGGRAEMGPARIAWALCLLTVAAAGAQTALLVTAGVPLLSVEALDQAFPVITVAIVLGAVVGAAIVQRHPRHRIGWLFCGGQVGAALGGGPPAVAPGGGPRGWGGGPPGGGGRGGRRAPVGPPPPPLPPG